jgi:hypothetical protein
MTANPIPSGLMNIYTLLRPSCRTYRKVEYTLDLDGLAHELRPQGEFILLACMASELAEPHRRFELLTSK